MEAHLIYNYLDDDDLLRISNKISEMEQITTGEIVVSAKEKRSLFQKQKPIQQFAEAEFMRLGINKTKGGTGILIFILLQERSFVILADDNINSKVSHETWEVIKEEMLGRIKEGNLTAAIIHGIESVGEILKPHFPFLPGTTNEISNRVIIRK